MELLHWAEGSGKRVDWNPQTGRAILSKCRFVIKDKIRLEKWGKECALTVGTDSLNLRGSFEGPLNRVQRSSNCSNTHFPGLHRDNLYETRPSKALNSLRADLFVDRQTDVAAEISCSDERQLSFQANICRCVERRQMQQKGRGLVSTTPSPSFCPRPNSEQRDSRHNDTPGVSFCPRNNISVSESINTKEWIECLAASAATANAAAAAIQSFSADVWKQQPFCNAVAWTKAAGNNSNTWFSQRQCLISDGHQCPLCFCLQPPCLHKKKETLERRIRRLCSIPSDETHEISLAARFTVHLSSLF